MNILGLQITRAKTELVEKTLNPVYGSGSWWGFIRESFGGAWQGNVVVDRNETLTFFCVYACISLIARDIAKMRMKLVEQQASGIWQETESAAFSPVLKKPNHYQTRIKFFEQWIVSKLVTGNTYVLKERDARGVVVKLYILDPARVTALVSEGGDVFYQLRTDYISGITAKDITVPASEIIHDTCITLFHPLLGVSPLYACGVAATQGMAIQGNSTKLFGNMSRPGGILTAPGAIKDETAARLKAAWETNYSGDNYGKTAVLGDGLKYEAVSMVTPVDAQLVEQLKMSAEVVCSTFHVPAYMVGVGPMPAYNNIEALNQQYYSQALQEPIECIELLLDEGLGLVSAGFGAEFDLDGLLRMDTAARYAAYTAAIGGGWFAPNEARKREDMKPAKGGDSPMMQQQQYSLEALSVRDQDKPFAKPAPAAPAPTPNDTPPKDDPSPAKEITVYVEKEIDPFVRELMWTALLQREFDEDEPQPINIVVEQPSIVVRNEVQPTPVQVEATHVHVAPPLVNVTSPNITVRNEVQPTPVNVEGAHINVVPSEVVIENRAGDVHVTNPTPQVSVTNKMEPVTNINVEPANFTVEAPNVNVEAPQVTVANNIPEYEVLEQEHQRDKKGQLVKTITTKRRRKDKED